MPLDSDSLLGPDEPPPVEIVNADGRSNAVLVCDHASNRVPQKLGTLGLDADQLMDHIGWDPGAAEVARHLSKLLDAPLVLSGYSRLVIDCNRPLENTQSIAEQSAGIPIPGNHGLSPKQKQLRINTLFQPYHSAINRLLEKRGNSPTLFLSIHSFTPELDGRPRPWHVGVSYWRDGRFASLMREALARNGDLVVGDNEPYPIEDDIDYTIPAHGENRGLPSLMIEIRQDQVQTEAHAHIWASRLAAAYCLIEAEALLYFES
jgi:predicted N-formylglutamate amidohydrolase